MNINPIAKENDSRQPPANRRFLNDEPAQAAGFLQAAKDYVGKLPGPICAYLYEKPFDRSLGAPTNSADLHASYYRELYPVLNLLQAMEVPFGGRIVEVGSGPGWVTEIFLGLGYSVDCIEPSLDMIHIAEERIKSFHQHLRREAPPDVRFHCCTLEDCELPDDSFDAVFFAAALHHVFDEEAGLAQCIRLLKPGGVLGVHESSWLPGNRQMEAMLKEEMERFGTLENPFTIEYLDYLLQKHGFVEVERYHGINGLFPSTMGRMRLEDIAQSPASTSNTLTARKPDPSEWRGPTSADLQADTRGAIEVLSVRTSECDSRIHAKVRLLNCGTSSWLNKLGRPGSVSLALYRGEPGEPNFLEAEPRQAVSKRLLPGEEWTGDFVYNLPGTNDLSEWRFCLISEHLFWFFQRGSPSVHLNTEMIERA